jgi:predicted enzyme related to lactoylglutathione lyase
MHLEFTLDVNDPARMIAFWTALLRYELQDEPRFEGVEQTYWSIIDPSGHGPRIVIQRVPEPVTCKTRLHLDLHVADIEAEALRAVSLGAIRVDTQPVREVGETWIRLSDPEGNLFCIVHE